MYCYGYTHGPIVLGNVLEGAIMLLQNADKANNIDYLKIQAIGRKEGELLYYK